MMIYHERQAVAPATEITHRCCAFFPRCHILFAILVAAAFSVCFRLFIFLIAHNELSTNSKLFFPFVPNTIACEESKTN
jgi:hypothetical protein